MAKSASNIGSDKTVVDGKCGDQRRDEGGGCPERHIVGRVIKKVASEEVAIDVNLRRIGELGVELSVILVAFDVGGVEEEVEG